MTAAFYISLLVALVVVVHCKGKGSAKSNYTVTEEAWFDIEIKDFDGPGDDYRGRIVIGLFGKTCPMTCLNFASMTKGYKRGREFLHYKNTRFHRIVPDFVIQGGDNTVGDGTGGKSIFGDKFVDENFDLSHRAAGMVSMANHGKDTNGAQFFILLTRSRWLDSKHVVFGKVVKGMDVLKTIGEVPADPNTAVPKKTVKVIDCGLVGLDGNSYELTEEQVDSDDDVN